MSFNLTVRSEGDVSILDLEGRLVLGEGSGELRNGIKSLLAAGNKKILINLSRVSYIDSSGLGELVSAYASVSGAGGQIKLENVQTKVLDLLQITKLNSVFETFPDEGTALKSFRAAAAGA